MSILNAKVENDEEMMKSCGSSAANWTVLRLNEQSKDDQEQWAKPMEFATGHSIESIDPASSEKKYTVLFRFWIFFFGVVCPLSCLSASIAGMGITDLWQSGKAEHFACLLLQPPTIYYPFPFFVYSFLSLGVWTIQPDLAKWMVVRLGIYTGSFVAILYSLIAVIAQEGSTFLAAFFVAVVALIIHASIKLLADRKRRITIRGLMIATAVIACTIAMARFTFHGAQFESIVLWPIGLLLIVAMALLVAAPTLGAAVFIWTSMEIVSIRAIDSAPIPFLTTKWLVGWCVELSSGFVAWRYAVQSMMEEYTKLPLTDPSCYVSSAAAHGHPWLVRSFKSVEANGPIINRQMQRIKLLEFALASSLPGLHRFIRFHYDRFGPLLAATCRSRTLFADLTYLGLLPLEISAEILRMILGISTASVRRIYLPKNS